MCSPLNQKQIRNASSLTGQALVLCQPSWPVGYTHSHSIMKIQSRGWCVHNQKLGGYFLKWLMHTQLHPSLYNPMNCSPPGSSVHGTLQARMLEWVASSYSKGSSPPRDRTWVSCIAGGLLFFFLTFYFYFILLYNTVLVLPYIDMNPPRVYMQSQT